MNFISRLANTLFEFIFPKSAEVLALEELSPSDMLKVFPQAPDTGEARTLAIFAYSHPVVREMIWELKYRGNQLVAEKLASVLMDFLQEELAERAANENFIDPILIPVPISDKRRNERGYNQCEFW